MSTHIVQDTTIAAPLVKTSFLILSDTHGLSLAGMLPNITTDVVIHCGGLTEESKLDEYRTTISLLRSLKAPLKLVIAGNHDFTLDESAFQRKVEEARSSGIEPELVRKFYGDFGEVSQLFLNAEKEGIHLLDEGNHEFDLDNGAKLKAYASQYTPALGEWGFQYPPSQGHNFDIAEGTHVVMTHGPPHGVLDRTAGRERAGDSQLFAAVARIRPHLHCFGHIHHEWGAKMVTWRDQLSDPPSHLTDIDNDNSRILEQISTLESGKFDSPEDAKEKERKLRRLVEQKYCKSDDPNPPQVGMQTLFVNAAIKVSDETDPRLAWLVKLELPSAASSLKDLEGGMAEGTSSRMEVPR